MIKKFYIFVLSLAAISITFTDAMASTSNSYKVDGNGDETMPEESFSESRGYPINAPIPQSTSSEKKKNNLYIVMENIFSDEMSARITGKRIPASSGIMDDLIGRFQKFPISATEGELIEVFINTFLYLDSFYSGYQNVTVLFKEEIGRRGRSYLNAKDVDLVLSIPMALDKKQKLLRLTVQALNTVIGHPFIGNWFRNLAARYPIESIGPITKQGLCEGVNAGVEEFSCPTMEYSREDGVWYWQAQLFSVRSRNLELLSPFLTQLSLRSSNLGLFSPFLAKTEGTLEPQEDAVDSVTISKNFESRSGVVTVTPAPVKSSCFGFWKFFSCGNVCD